MPRNEGVTPGQAEKQRMKDEKTAAKRAELATHRERLREWYQTLHHTPAWLKDALDKFKGLTIAAQSADDDFHPRRRRCSAAAKSAHPPSRRRGIY